MACIGNIDEVVHDAAMRQLLSRHPDLCGIAAARVEVSIMRAHTDRLVLSYSWPATSAISACRPACQPQRRTLAAHLLRGICPGFVGRGILRIQLFAFDTMGRIYVQRLPKRDGYGG